MGGNGRQGGHSGHGGGYGGMVGMVVGIASVQVAQQETPCRPVAGHCIPSCSAVEPSQHKRLIYESQTVLFTARAGLWISEHHVAVNLS